jgi:hypothetical protein
MGLYHFENIPKGEYTIHVQDPNVKEPNWGPAAYRRVSVADDNAVIASGRSQWAVSRQLGCSINTVRLWLKRFREERLAGLFSRHRGKTGGPRVYSPLPLTRAARGLSAHPLPTKHPRRSSLPVPSDPRPRNRPTINTHRPRAGQRLSPTHF